VYSRLRRYPTANAAHTAESRTRRWSQSRWGFGGTSVQRPHSASSVTYTPTQTVNDPLPMATSAKRAKRDAHACELVAKTEAGEKPETECAGNT